MALSNPSRHQNNAIKLMLFPEECQARFLQWKKNEYRNFSHLRAGILEKICSKLLERTSALELTAKDPDLIICTYVPFDQWESLCLAYPNVKKIFIFGENLYAKAYHHERTRYALLKFSNALHLSKHAISQLEQIRILPRKRTTNIAVPAIQAFLENLKPNEFVVISNDYMNHKMQKEQVFSYPFFMRWNKFLYDIIEKHGDGEKANDWQKRKFCCYIQNRHTAERKIFLKMLSRYKKVDCYGAAGPNNIEGSAKTLPMHRHTDNDKIYQHYKFVIAFENSIADGYITEKIIIPMSANAIPLYWGTSSVNKYFNPDSFLSCDNYESLSAMARAVIELDQDEQRYLAMLRQPFFPGNQLPAAITDTKKNFEHFLDRALNL